MKKLLMILPGLFLLDSQAWAGFWSCAGKNSDFSFSAKGTIDGSTEGLPIRSVTGQVKFKKNKELDMPPVNFEREHLKSQRAGNGHFNITLFSGFEDGEFAGRSSVEVKTELGRDGTFRGTVTVDQFLNVPGLSKPTRLHSVAPVNCDL